MLQEFSERFSFRLLQCCRTSIPFWIAVSVAVPASWSQVSLGQGTPTKPLVFLREVRVDSLLLAFGVDTARIRSAVEDALRNAGRLASTQARSAPSLDISVTAMRSAYGGTPEPRGFVLVEVGRNLMESRVAQRLVWEGTEDLAASPTFRELSRGTLATILRVVNAYLLGRGRA